MQHEFQLPNTVEKISSIYWKPLKGASFQNSKNFGFQILILNFTKQLRLRPVIKPA